MPKAVVLLSGGLDSSTVLDIAIEKGFEPVALTFDYGQRHRREIESARDVARHFKVKDHLVFRLDLASIAKSSLTDARKTLRRPATRDDISKGVPDTYVPSRNMVFLSIASSLAESRGAEAVFIAANSVDFSGYPDCTAEFLAAFQKVLQTGTVVGIKGKPVRLEAPILSMSKDEIVREAMRLKVPLTLTWSCYEGGERACGKCDSCVLRREGFEKAGVRDPIEYEVDG
jgi:7-cyano-7-deazaguanine synthase